MKKIFFFLCLLLLGQMSIAQNVFPYRIKVGTYNIGHFNQGDIGGFKGKNKAAELARWKAWVALQGLDILFFQEWNTYFDKDSTYHAQNEILNPTYNQVYFGKPYTWIFNGIATNYKLQNLRQVQFNGDYYAIIGDWNIGNKTIAVASVHVPWQENWHLESIEDLIKELKKYEYFICAGDMNAKDNVQKKFLEAGFNIANGGNQGWFYTSANAKTLQKTNGHLDNIVTSKNIKIVGVSSAETGLNDQDHFPIMADLIITD